MWNFLNEVFSAHLYKRTLSCCHPDIGVGGGLGVTFIRFMTKLFYVMGKVRLGELFYMRTGLGAMCSQYSNVLEVTNSLYIVVIVSLFFLCLTLTLLRVSR